MEGRNLFIKIPRATGEKKSLPQLLEYEISDTHSYVLLEHFFLNLFYLFIFGHVGSSLLRAGFL